jgi:hypothetical protein
MNGKNFNDAFSFHYYDGEDEEIPRLEVRELLWIDDWPVVSDKNFFAKD